MGCGTTFITEVYLHKETYSNVEEVKSKIQELENNIEHYKTRLKLMVISSPKEVMSEEEKDMDVIWWVDNNIGELTEQMEEDVYHLALLNLYLEYLQEETKIDKNDKKRKGIQSFGYGFIQLFKRFFF